MAKLNCWEFKQCGREPGGQHESDLGPCPAAKPNSQAHGSNSGKNGGRICWKISGTFCGGKPQGTFAEKQLSCMTCKFFQLVESEEGADFRLEGFTGSNI